MKKIKIIFLIILILFPLFSFAQRWEIEYPGGGPRARNLPEYIRWVFIFACGSAAILTFLMIVIGGIQYMASVGKPEARNDALDRIKKALLGLILLFGSYLILNTINPQFLILKEPKIPTTFPPLPPFPGWEIKYPFGQPVQDDLAGYIILIYQSSLIVGSVLAFLMITIGGVQYMISVGRPGARTNALDRIKKALWGLVLLFGSYFLLYQINPQLVRIGLPDLSELVESITPEEEREEESEKGRPPIVWDVNKNITTYDESLKKEAGKYGLDCTLLKAIMLVESGGNPNAVSHKGACGLMQLLPVTARKTCEALKNPDLNIKLGAKHFAGLLRDTCPKQAKTKAGKLVKCDPSRCGCRKNDVNYALAAYNGGKGANCCSVSCQGKTWWECGANPGFRETRNYVIKVISTKDFLKGRGWGC